MFDCSVDDFWLHLVCHLVWRAFPGDKGARRAQTSSQSPWETSDRKCLFVRPQLTDKPKDVDSWKIEFSLELWHLQTCLYVSQGTKLEMRIVRGVVVIKRKRQCLVEVDSIATLKDWKPVGFSLKCHLRCALYACYLSIRSWGWRFLFPGGAAKSDIQQAEGSFQSTMCPEQAMMKHICCASSLWQCCIQC